MRHAQRLELAPSSKLLRLCHELLRAIILLLALLVIVLGLGSRTPLREHLLPLVKIFTDFTESSDDRAKLLNFLGAKVVPRVASGATWISFWTSFGPPGSHFSEKKTGFSYIFSYAI